VEISGVPDLENPAEGGTGKANVLCLSRRRR
jgi:hypothetical protein